MYSRRIPERARLANVQCRFMKYELVAAMTVETHFAHSGAMPSPKTKALRITKSSAVLMAPMTPNLLSSAANTRHWWLIDWGRCTRRE